MSASFSQKKPKCPTCGHKEDYESIQITYNISPIWYAMFPEDDRIIPIDGLTGKEAETRLTDAIQKMLGNEDELKKLNPQNGWGSFDGLLKCLIEIQHHCKINPDLTWEVWR